MDFLGDRMYWESVPPQPPEEASRKCNVPENPSSASSLGLCLRSRKSTPPTLELGSPHCCQRRSRWMDDVAGAARYMLLPVALNPESSAMWDSCRTRT